MTDLTGTGVRALLIGTASHTGPELPPLPSVARSVTALAGALRDRCGLDGSRLRVLPDPPDARTMAEAVAAEARAADSVLLIYYLGHGLLGPRDELHLAASGTGTLTPGLAAHQALPFSAIGEALTDCRASCAVVILDCCFSGRAGLAPAAGEPAFTLPAAHGMYLLASAERLALAPGDQEHTLFTGAFIDFLVNGDPRGPRLLTLDDAYDHLFRVLRAGGGPLPRRQAGDRSGELILTVNRAAPPGPPAADEEPGTPAGSSPYPGLSAFGVDDAHLFRGRGKLTADLAAAAAGALAASSPLVVVGPSGSGKSSLLQAGLLARLRGGAPELPGSAAWPWITLSPGDHPLSTLAARLDPGGARPAELLRRDPAAAAGLLDRLLDRQPAAADRPAPRRLVLVCDQFEQLFTRGAGPAEQTAFLTALWSLARPEGTGSQALVVLALRADFYAQAAAHPQLLTALTSSQFLVGPMTTAELRAAIEQPAQAAGLRLDEGLADVILHELGAMDGAGAAPGALPLLSHTLWAVWRRHSGSRLTMADYRAVGGVAEAIATTADTAYHELGARERAAVRRMLPRLVRVRDDAPDTAAQVGREALLRGLPYQEAAEQALGRLADARLLTADRDAVGLSHEALLRSWPLLAQWIDADRDWLRVSQRLAGDARAWQRSGQDRSLLYRGGRLAGVRERAAGSGRADELPPDAAAFLAASQQAERRAHRLRTGVIAVLSLLLVLASASAGMAAYFQQQTAGQKNEILARLVAAEAGELRSTSPSLATQLSLAAYRLDPGVGTGGVFASQSSPGAYDESEPVVDMAQRTDGRVLAISTGTGLRLWDTRGYELAPIGPLATGPVVIGSARRLLAAGAGPVSRVYGGSASCLPGPAGGCDQVRLWDIARPAHPRQLATVRLGNTDVIALAFSPDERVLVVSLSGGTVQPWDLADPRRPRPLPPLPGDGKEVGTLAFAPHGRLLATTGADHVNRLWDLTDAAHGRLLAHWPGPAQVLGDPVHVVRHRLAFSPDGRLLATDSGKGGVRIWDVRSPRHPRAVTQPEPFGTCDQLLGLAFSPLGTSVVASCSDELQVWAYYPDEQPASRLQKLASLGNTGSGNSSNNNGGRVLFQPGRPRVLSVSPAGVQVWDLHDPAAPGALSSVTARTGLAPGQLAFSMTGRPWLADTADIAAIRLWDLSNLRSPRDRGYYPAIIPHGTGAEVNALAGGVALSRDGRLLAGGQVRNGRPTVALWRTAAPHAPPAAIITRLDNGALALAFSRQGRLLAVVDNSDYQPAVRKPPGIKLFSLADLAHPRLVAELPGNVYDVAISPDGNLVTGYTANTVLCWDISKLTRPVRLRVLRLTPTSLVTGGAFAPGGGMLAIGDSTGLLQLWGIRHDRLSRAGLASLHEPGNANLSLLSFSPAGKILAMPGFVSGDIFQPAVELWDLSHPARPVLEAQFADPNGDEVLGLAFSPRSHALAVEGNNTVTLWDTDPAQVARSLCAAAGDPISKADWERYVPHVPYRPPCAAAAGG